MINISTWTTWQAGSEDVQSQTLLRLTPTHSQLLPSSSHLRKWQLSFKALRLKTSQLSLNPWSHTPLPFLQQISWEHMKHLIISHTSISHQNPGHHHLLSGWLQCLLTISHCHPCTAGHSGSWKAWVHTIRPSNPTTGHIHWENRNSKRVRYHNVHCSSILQ